MELKIKKMYFVVWRLFVDCPNETWRRERERSADGDLIWFYNLFRSQTTYICNWWLCWRLLRVLNERIRKIERRMFEEWNLVDDRRRPSSDISIRRIFYSKSNIQNRVLYSVATDSIGTIELTTYLNSAQSFIKIKIELFDNYFHKIHKVLCRFAIDLLSNIDELCY